MYVYNKMKQRIHMWTCMNVHFFRTTNTKSSYRRADNYIYFPLFWIVLNFFLQYTPQLSKRMQQMLCNRMTEEKSILQHALCKTLTIENKIIIESKNILYYKVRLVVIQRQLTWIPGEHAYSITLPIITILYDRCFRIFFTSSSDWTKSAKIRIL